MTGPVISVVIPVYNVGAYLDTCLESVLAQTFSSFEVLLINDGSTDDSSVRCRSWAKKDSRIRLIEKENEGVSASRNLGIDLAQGVYLAFLDPDDWIEKDYLEKLCAAIRTSGALFAECDLWRYDNRTGKKIYRSCYGRMGVPYTLEEHMKYGPTATYKALSKRDLWICNSVRMPDCDFESPAVYALILALAGGVASVREPLYYYRRFREHSLIETGYAAKDGSANNRLGIDAMRYLLHAFQDRGLGEKYADTLPGIVFYRLNDILAMQYHRKNPRDFRELVQNHRVFLAEAFPDVPNPVYMVWGGYNLSRILMHMDMTHDPSMRYGFSSILSVMTPPCETGQIMHSNAYRRIMLEKEMERSFWKDLETVRPSILFLDLLEERFDLLRVGECLVTASDAWEGSSLRGMQGERIPRAACDDAWRRSAGSFIDRIRTVSPDTQLVVVENYLTKEVGTLQERKPFAEQNEIIRINERLKEYYTFLRFLAPEALWIDPSDDSLYFTDAHYEYGAVSSHLNALENEKIAESIQRTLMSKKEQKYV